MDRDALGLLSRYPAAPRRLLTVDEYHRMGEAGILTEDDRVELIEGELVAMVPIGSEHASARNALTRLLVLAVGDRGIVAVGNPVRLNNRSEPHRTLRCSSPMRGIGSGCPGRTTPCWPWKFPIPVSTSTVRACGRINASMARGPVPPASWCAQAHHPRLCSVQQRNRGLRAFAWPSPAMTMYAWLSLQMKHLFARDP